MVNYVFVWGIEVKFLMSRGGGGEGMVILRIVVRGRFKLGVVDSYFVGLSF